MAENATSEELRTAVDLLKEGKVAEARVLLIDAVTQNPRDELGWFLLSFAVRDPKQQVDCLERVLRINPSNSNARARLEKLGGTPPPEPIPQPVTPPFVTGEGETPAAETPVPVQTPAREEVQVALQPPEAAIVGVPDQHVTPVIFEQGGGGEGETPEELPEEGEEQEARPEAREPQPAPEKVIGGGPPLGVAPAPEARAGPAGTSEAVTRMRSRPSRARAERAPGWMIAIIVILLLVVVLGAGDVGWTYLRSQPGSGPQGPPATATQGAAVNPSPPTPVMSLPPEWTRTPTVTLTVTPSETPIPSDTPTAAGTSLTPSPLASTATLSSAASLAQLKKTERSGV